MYLLVTARKGISSMQLAKEIGITQKSAWFKEAHDCLVIEILLRLIQDNRIPLLVDKQIEDQQQSTPLPR